VEQYTASFSDVGYEVRSDVHGAAREGTADAGVHALEDDCGGGGGGGLA